MLFNYIYVPHKIEKFQIWLDHLVKEVWCKASGDFHVDLLHADLQAVVHDIYNIEDMKPRGKVGDWLYGPIRKIFDLFKGLTSQQREQISDWYDNNNDIEALCANDLNKLPGTYEDIKAINEDLAEELKNFGIALFITVIDLGAVKKRLDTSIDEHYRDFMNVNNRNRCPYCNLYKLDGEYDFTRDAYDHFLSKAIYAFNSINFRNLAPMCNKCNSGYKLKKDPIRRIESTNNVKAYTRRKAFYSYATVPTGIYINLSFSTLSSIDQLTPSRIDLTITASGRDEEVETWKDVFGIEQRYKAHCCGKDVVKSWIVQVTEECANYGVTPDIVLTNIERQFIANPWSGENFLKLPFLRACQKAGFF